MAPHPAPRSPPISPIHPICQAYPTAASECPHPLYESSCLLANDAKARGIHVYHLNIGQPDLPTPQEGLDALKKIDREILEYSPSEGLLSLRRKLADYYHRFNINVDVDDIIVTAGGSEAVLFAFMACLDPGDEIIVPEPAYANYMAFAISAGAKIDCALDHRRGVCPPSGREV